MAMRWRVDPGLPKSKFDVTFKDGWYTATRRTTNGRVPGTTRYQGNKVGKTSPNATVTLGPKPQKASPTPRVPKDYLGDPTVMGSYKNEPNLNPTQYEWEQDPVSGRYFARPRTELTGMTTQDQQQVKAYDASTQAQQDLINRVNEASYSRALAQSQANAQAMQQYQALGGQAVNPGDPTAMQLQGAFQAGQTAGSTPALAQMLNQPSLVQDAGATRLSGYTGQRQQARQQLISGLRQQEASNAIATAKNEASLRNQNIQTMLKLMGLDNTANTAQLRANTALAGIDAQNQRSANSLNSQQAIATMNEQGRNNRSAASLAVQQQKLAASIKAKGGLTASNRAALLKQAQRMVQGIPTGNTKTTRAPDGSTSTQKEKVTYNYDEVVAWLVSAGVPKAQAKQMASAAGAMSPQEAATNISSWGF